MGVKEGEFVPHPTRSSNDRGNTAASPATNNLAPRTCPRLHKATETSKNLRNRTPILFQATHACLCIQLANLRSKGIESWGRKLDLPAGAYQ